jgi:hydrogenase/urease accessory protein HupE
MWCTSAQAHLASTGLGPIYDGISHLFLSVDDLLPVVAMALLAGLNGPAAGRWALFVLPVAWLAGGVIGLHSGVAGAPAGVTSLSLLLLGILVAADRRLRWPVVAVLAGALGLMHGALNGAGIATAQREASGLVGIVGAVFVLTALASALVLSLRPPWTRIVVRVAGSWIAATGLLMLGWSLSGRL